MFGNECINNNVWIEYSKQKLGKTELDRIIFHTQKCEICADIKEGIDLMQKPLQLEQITQNINSNINKKSSKISLITPFYKYASAVAVFIAVVGLAWYFGKKTKPEIVLNKLEKIVPQTSNSITVDTSNSFSINKDSKEFSQQKSNLQLNEQTEFTDSLGIKKAEEISFSLNQPKTVEADLNSGVAEDVGSADVNPELESNKDSYKNIEENESLKPTSTDKIIKLKKMKQLSKEKYPSNKRYNNNNNKSIDEDDYSPKTYKINKDSVLYQNANNIYKNKMYDSCVTYINLNPILNNSGYYEKILYLKALALIKLKRNHEAKAVLTELVNLKGSYYRKAKKLLKNID